MEWLKFFFKKKPAGSTLATPARPPRVAVSVVYVPAVRCDVVSCRRSEGDEMKCRWSMYLQSWHVLACAHSYAYRAQCCPQNERKRAGHVGGTCESSS